MSHMTDSECLDFYRNEITNLVSDISSKREVNSVLWKLDLVEGVNFLNDKFSRTSSTPKFYHSEIMIFDQFDEIVFKIIPLFSNITYRFDLRLDGSGDFYLSDPTTISK